MVGCGSDRSSLPPRAAAAPSDSVTSLTVIGCAPTQRPLALPAGWPAELPLPPGLVVTRTERRLGQPIISGFVPEEFAAVLVFMQQQLPAAGYPLEDGEVEKGDAESSFSGHSLYGRWKLQARPDCGRFTQVTVAIL